MDIQDIKNQANIYLQQEDFTTAINLYEKCIELMPNVIDNYWYLGLAWLLSGNEIASQSIWLSTLGNSALEVQENDLINLINLLKYHAGKYVENHNYELAQSIYESILNWDDSHVEIYDKLANCLAMQGKLEEAINYWQIITDIVPDDINSYLHQGKIWQKLENFNDAISCYENILKIDSSYENEYQQQYHEKYLIYYQMGLCYSQIQQWQIAINRFSQSIAIKSDFAPAYSDLGLTFIYNNNVELGINYLTKAVELEPEFCEYLVNSSQRKNLQLSNNYLIRISLVKSLLNGSKHLHQKIDSVYLEVYLNLAKTLADKYPDIAIQLLQKTREIADNNIFINLELAKVILNQINHHYIHQTLNILKDVLDDLTNIINNQINNQELYPELYYLKSQYYIKLEDYPQAIIHLQTLIELEYKLEESYYLLGIAFLNLGNIEIAHNTLLQQLTINSNSPITLAYLGFISGKKHQIQAAISYFQQAISINSSIITFIDQLINVLIVQDTRLNKLDFSAILPISPPDKYYELTEHCIENSISHNSGIASQYITIYPEINIRLNYPKTLDDTIHFSFRFGQNIKLPASFVVTIPQGRFWLSQDQTQSAIIIHNSHFLADISPGFPILQPYHPDKHPSHHAILSLENLPPIHFIDGNVLVLSGLTNNIYFHWMLDILPRWELFRLGNIHLDVSFDEVDYFVVDNSLPFQKETLRLLQIPENKQININQIHHLQASNLIVPSFPGTIAWMPKWVSKFLKTRFLLPEYIANIANNYPNKRIYITRKLAKSRRILNEEEIINLLISYGFEVVVLESMLVVEQAALFSQAEVIISPHGSGLTNLVFCEDGTKVIELLPPNYVYHCYWWISNLISLDYYYLLGETLPGWYFHHLVYPQEFSEDIVINIDNLKKLLKLAAISQ